MKPGFASGLNLTLPASLAQGLEKATGVDVAKAMVAHVRESVLKKRAAGGRRALGVLKDIPLQQDHALDLELRTPVLAPQRSPDFPLGGAGAGAGQLAGTGSFQFSPLSPTSAGAQGMGMGLGLGPRAPSSGALAASAAQQAAAASSQAATAGKQQ